MTLDRIVVSWEVAPTFQDVLDYTMRIQRSESPEGPFEYITQPFEDKYTFVDHIVITSTRMHRDWYYKIEVTKKSDSSTKTFGPQKNEPAEDKIAREMRRQALLKLHTVSGRRCWLFIRRTHGQRCGNCYDPVTKTSTDSQCLTCYGTKFVRGYMDPVEVYVSFDPSPKTVVLDTPKVERAFGATALMGFYPEAKEGDLLVEAENRRWSIRAVQSPTRLRAKVRQVLHMDEIGPGDIEHKIPINLEDLNSSDFANTWLFAPKTDIGGEKVWLS